MTIPLEQKRIPNTKLYIQTINAWSVWNQLTGELLNRVEHSRNTERSNMTQLIHPLVGSCPISNH